MIKNIGRILSTFLVINFLTSCFPDRSPVSPEEYETRRPQVAFVQPLNGDTLDGSENVRTKLWFDELMQENTIREKFSIHLTREEELWTEINTVRCLSQSHSNTSLMIAGLSEKGVFSSADNGLNWSFVDEMADFQINSFKYDPTNSGIIFALAERIILKSVDGGSTWTNINNNLPADLIFFSFNLDPSNSDFIWLGTSNGIFLSRDAGGSWMKKGDLPVWSGQEISKIVVDYTNPSIVYAATQGRYVYKSTDTGDTWAMKRGNTSQLGATRIFDLLIDANDASIIYAATVNRGIYKSSDAAENWTAVNNGIDDLDTRKIRYDQTDQSRIYLTTIYNIYYSQNQGETWEQIEIPTNNKQIVEFLKFNEIVLAVSDNIYEQKNASQSWHSINDIDLNSIQVSGEYKFSSWQGLLSFIISDEDDQPDTLFISPYRYNDALAAYDAGLQDEPPVDPNPKATNLVFQLTGKLFPGWNYRLCISGAFSENVWRETNGVQDFAGMSLEFDYISYFYLK